MTQDRFKNLLRFMRFSFQPKEKLEHVSEEGFAKSVIGTILLALKVTMLVNVVGN